MQANKPDQQAIVEWLVRCIEDTATRGEGAVELKWSFDDIGKEEAVDEIEAEEFVDEASDEDLEEESGENRKDEDAKTPLEAQRYRSVLLKNFLGAVEKSLEKKEK